MFDPLTTQSRNLDPRFTCYRHQPHLRFALHHTDNSSNASHTLREYPKQSLTSQTKYTHTTTANMVVRPHPHRVATRVASSHTDTNTAGQGRALCFRRGTRFVQTFNTSVTSWLIDHSLRLPRRRATLHWPHVGALSHTQRALPSSARDPSHRYRLHRRPFKHASQALIENHCLLAHPPRTLSIVSAPAHCPYTPVPIHAPPIPRTRHRLTG